MSCYLLLLSLVLFLAETYGWLLVLFVRWLSDNLLASEGETNSDEVDDMMEPVCLPFREYEFAPVWALLSMWGGLLNLSRSGARFIGDCRQVPITKSVFVRATVTGIFMTGWICAHWWRRFGNRCICVVDREVEAQSLRAIIDFRKAPDPEESPKERQRMEMKRHKQSLKRLGRVLMLMSTLPSLVSSRDSSLRDSLRGYLLSDGMLNTRDLPVEVRDKVLTAMSDLPMGFFSSKIEAADGVIDTGATHIGTWEKEDFIPGTFELFQEPKQMGGIAGTLDIKGKGIVRYEMVARNGKVKAVEREAYYIPGLPVRLIPPQVIFAKGVKGHCMIRDGQCALDFGDGRIVDTEINHATN